MAISLRGHIAFTQDPENQIAPLAFQFGAIYFYRAWQDEFRVAQYIKNALKNDRTLSVEPQQIRALLDRYFPQQQAQIDWQKVAVATAVKSPFSVITGGPGTGKPRQSLDYYVYYRNYLVANFILNWLRQREKRRLV